MSRAYYNEIDPYCAQWLRNLIDAAFIPDGDVDTRSISEVSAGDVKGYTQCHFFAGIAGWPYALRLAGWSEHRRVWTGSCPCQPFSVAGRQKGKEDARHLWPDFHRLIGQVRPDVVMGEQVSGRAGLDWLDGVSADLEAVDYRVRAIDIPACGAGAPHIRNRLYWVAQSQIERLSTRQPRSYGDQGQTQSHDGPLADRLGDASSLGRGAEGRNSRIRPEERRETGWLGDTYSQGSQGWREHSGEHAGQFVAGQAGITAAWGDFDITWCLDERARRFEPGSFPLAHGVPQRVGKLRAYGNAIVPALAAEVIKAYMKVYRL